MVSMNSATLPSTHRAASSLGNCSPFGRCDALFGAERPRATPCIQARSHAFCRRQCVVEVELAGVARRSMPKVQRTWLPNELEAYGRSRTVPIDRRGVKNLRLRSSPRRPWRRQRAVRLSSEEARRPNLQTAAWSSEVGRSDPKPEVPCAGRCNVARLGADVEWARSWLAL
jgi:hypothetical protein